jgi:hypothetical protein
MKRLTLLGLLAALLVLGVGCTATLPNASVSAVEYEEDEFEVLGPVEGSATMSGLLGGMYVLKPDGGYYAAYRDALSKRPGANALINTYSDAKITQYFFGWYIRIETKVYGTAIRVEDEKLALPVQ